MKLEIGGLYSSADSKSDFDIFYFEKSKMKLVIMILKSKIWQDTLSFPERLKKSISQLVLELKTPM